jgi:hypothetical protein
MARDAAPVLAAGAASLLLLGWLVVGGVRRAGDPLREPETAAAAAAAAPAESAASPPAAARAEAAGPAAASPAPLPPSELFGTALPELEGALKAGRDADLEKPTRSGLLVPLRPGGKAAAARVAVEALDPPTAGDRSEQLAAVAALTRQLVEEDLAGTSEPRAEVAALADDAERAARGLAEREPRLGRLTEEQSFALAERAREASYARRRRERAERLQSALSSSSKLLVKAPGDGPAGSERMLVGSGGASAMPLVRPPPDVPAEPSSGVPPAPGRKAVAPPLRALADLPLDAPPSVPATLSWSAPSERMLVKPPPADAPRPPDGPRRSGPEVSPAPELGGPGASGPRDCDGCAGAVGAGRAASAFGVRGAPRARATGAALSLRYLGPCAEGHAYEVTNGSPRPLPAMTLEGDAGQAWPIGPLGPGRSATIKSSGLLESLRARSER